MLRFQPKEGSVIYCNYVGFIAPEMVKKRPVIVIRKHRHNSKLLYVVPISTTEPKPILEYHIEMDKEFCLTHLNGKRSWVKCDIINTVTLERLNLVRDKKTGQRHTPNIGDNFLQMIQNVIRKECGL